MPKWSQYKQEAKSRGALALELFIVDSRLAVPPEQMREVLPDHLAYQAEMEAHGKLFLAGPLSDETGEEMSGSGMIVYRAGSIEEAQEIAANDPMHKNGCRTFTLYRWLVNEGSLSLNVGLSTKGVVLK